MNHVAGSHRPGTDEASRVRLATRPGTTSAMLRALATDPAVTVRAAVAMNPTYAPTTDRQLLTDPDTRVRALLGRKLAALLPGLSGAEHAAAQVHVHETLLALAQDAAHRVRAAIAEALTTLPEAPRHVILTLAADPEASVCNPILRFSPLLTDADLIELLATPAHAAKAIVVASRPDLSAAVSDHIAGHADSAAVCALLQNPSALIRESTLDGLIGRAADHPDWHEPLARRPSLPEQAARALSRIVAADVLDILAARADLSPLLAAELRGRVASTLGDAPLPPTEAEILDSVRRLNSVGQLTEASLLSAVAAGDHRQIAAILAVAAGVPLAALDRAVGLRSAKALVSLAWKAGFTMRAAQAVQATLGQLSPSETLAAGPIGEFPLSGDEMEWQVELLGEPGRSSPCPGS